MICNSEGEKRQIIYYSEEEKQMISCWKEEKQVIRYSLVIRGIVQGVGFRPFVFRLAKSFSVRGYVCNTSEGVYAEIEGKKEDCDLFIASLAVTVLFKEKDTI